MKLRLYDDANDFSLIDELSFERPETDGSAEFIWIRYKFIHTREDIAIYKRDGTAISPGPDGPLTSVSVTSQRPSIIIIDGPRQDGQN